MTLQDRIDQLVKQYGNMSKVAHALEIDVPYLHNLRSGKKSNPGDFILRKLGLKKVVSYELIEEGSKEYGNVQHKQKDDRAVPEA